jgi:5'-methylthioadenosine phosphorylase
LRERLKSGQSSCAFNNRTSFDISVCLCSYALIATSTDYDSWRLNEAPVTVEEIMKTLKSNADTSRKLAAALLEDVSNAIAKADVLTQAIGSMKFSITTAPHAQKPEDRKKLSYILPHFE